MAVHFQQRATMTTNDYMAARLRATCLEARVQNGGPRICDVPRKTNATTASGAKTENETLPFATTLTPATNRDVDGLTVDEQKTVPDCCYAGRQSTATTEDDEVTTYDRKDDEPQKRALVL
ncbi:unnamed protein product [Lasius platythorax]|uniref:Uncharacterized protein n=1 Tax=Lasius platythorax TaxID=488582 RepID=A0AAV2N0D3_9HYME